MRKHKRELSAEKFNNIRIFVIDEPNESEAFRDTFYEAMRDMLKACTVGKIFKKKPTGIFMDTNYYNYFLGSGTTTKDTKIIRNAKEVYYYVNIPIHIDSCIPQNSMLFANEDDMDLFSDELQPLSAEEKELEEKMKEEYVFAMHTPPTYIVCSDSRLHGLITSKKGVEGIKIIGGENENV